MSRKILAVVASWKGRGAFADGRKIVIPGELDGEPDKLVNMSVPLSKVDTLVASLYRARKAAVAEQARFGHPVEIDELEHSDKGTPRGEAPPAGVTSDFLRWLAANAEAYEREQEIDM